MWPGGVARISNVADELARLDMVAKSQIGSEHEVEVVLSVVGARSVVIKVRAETLPTIVAVDPKRVDLIAENSPERGNDWGHLGSFDVDPGVSEAATLRVVTVNIGAVPDEREDYWHFHRLGRKRSVREGCHWGWIFSVGCPHLPSH